MDNGVLDKLFSVASAVWAMFLLNAVALFKAWPSIMERLNERKRDAHLEKSSDWQRLRDEIDRLDGRCDDLRREIDLCHKERAEWMARAISAEAAHLGAGEAKQQAAQIVAIERLADRKDDDAG